MRHRRLPRLRFTVNEFLLSLRTYSVFRKKRKKKKEKSKRINERFNERRLSRVEIFQRCFVSFRVFEEEEKFDIENFSKTLELIDK